MTDKDVFDDLNFNEINLIINGWVERFPCIKGISLFRIKDKALNKSDPNQKRGYAFIFQVPAMEMGNDEYDEYYEWEASVHLSDIQHLLPLIYKPSSKNHNKDKWRVLTIPPEPGDKFDFRLDEDGLIISVSGALLYDLVDSSTEKQLYPAESDHKDPAGNPYTEAIKKGPINDISISKDENLTWKEISITFINDSEIHVQFKATGVTRTYGMAGFMDKRSKKPINAWTTLRASSKNGGKMLFDFESRKTIEKLAQAIRKKIRELFPNIKGDPIPLNKSFYQTDFHLRTTIE